MSTEYYTKDQADEKVQRRLRESFAPIDNIPRARGDENRMIMRERASILIHDAIGTVRFVDFLQAGTKYGENCRLCQLPSSLAVSSRGIRYDHVIFGNREQAIGIFGSSWQCAKPYSLFIQDVPPYPYQRQAYFVPPHHDKPPTQPDPHLNIPIAAAAKFAEQSLFLICSQLSPFKTPEAVCRHFTGHVSSPYSPLQFPGPRMLPVSPAERIIEAAPDVLDRLGMPDAESIGVNDVDSFLWRFLTDSHSAPRGKPIVPFRDACLSMRPFTDTFWSVWTPVIPYEDEHGEVIQDVIKVFSPQTQSKLLVPATRWKPRGIPHRFCYCVPCTGKQPLFNSQRLLDRPGDIVILTDSVEIASLNQPRSLLSNITWTGWLCDEGRYDQVDWEPLKGRGNVYYLITNHSGKSLDDAYLEAKQFHEYLMANEDELKINIRLVQACVEYPKNALRYVRLADIARHYHHQPPVVIRESVITVDPDKFAEYITAVEDRRRRPFITAEETPVVSDSHNDCSEDKVLLRPLIHRGNVTVLHAYPKVGKTCFTLSLCASIIAQDSFLEDRFWVVPKAVRGRVVVVYFDFECDKAKRDSTEISFILPYFSRDTSEMLEQKKRFHRIPLHDQPPGQKKRFDTDDHHEWFLKKIDECKKEAAEDSLFLVVFDPFLSAFGYEPRPNAWSIARRLFERIRHQKDAVLVVHHSSENGKPSGSANILRDASCEVVLSRIGRNAAPVLTEPAQVSLKETSWDKLEEDTIPFSVAYDPDSSRPWGVKPLDLLKAGDLAHPDRWAKVDPDKVQRMYWFCRLVRAYHANRKMDKEIEVELGMSHGAYSNMKNEINTLEDEGWEKRPKHVAK